MIILMEKFKNCCVHLSIGIAVLIGLAASEFSGFATIIALPITAFSITLSALIGSFLNSTDIVYKKRKFCDILEFFKIWSEILEILAMTATCARVASATVDYISKERFRELFLGIQSHSLGEPWPDVLGVSIIIVVTGLFMLGLEKPSSFCTILLLITFFTYVFFVSVGGTHMVLTLSKWYQDIKTTSVESVLTASALCSYGFVNTFPQITNYKYVKVMIMVVIPYIFYSSVIMVFTLMSHYRELMGTATPILRAFEIRDVDWARLVMAICVICIVCLALTEMLPTLYELFLTLASKEWQIFLSSLQFKSSLTGAPMLTIFAAGSLAAILAFACPIMYLVKILNGATLLKCILVSINVLYNFYKPMCTTQDSYSIHSNSTQYSKLKQSKKYQRQANFKNKICGCFFGLKKNMSPTSINSHKRKKKNKKTNVSQADNECLLLNDYCDQSVDIMMENDSSEESEEKESTLSSDVEDSNSSTDVDAAVQEYKDKIQVSMVDNFEKTTYPTYFTAAIAAICFFIVIVTSVFVFLLISWKKFNLIWICFAVLCVCTIVMLIMPKTSHQQLPYQLLPKSLIPVCIVISLTLNIILISTITEEIWPGFLFWILAGGLLFWRCECCTCDGLISNQKNKLNITDNIAQYSDNYVDTVMIAR